MSLESKKSFGILAIWVGQTDLVVLPEMFTSGFCVEQLVLAETMDGETVQSIRKSAVDFRR